MQPNITANLGTNQTPLQNNIAPPETTETGAITSKNRPRMNSREKGEIFTQPDGRRFRNGIELFLDSDVDSKSENHGEKPKNSESLPKNGSTPNHPDKKVCSDIDSNTKQIADESLATKFHHLQSAIQSGNLEEVKALITKHPDLGVKADPRGLHPLFEAMSSYHPEIAEILVSANIPLDYENDSGITAVTLAITKGYLSLAETLIQKGAAINQENKDGWTPLRFAVEMGNAPAVKLLIRAGANINHADKQQLNSLMSMAIIGNVEMVKLLICLRAEIDQANREGYTPLFFAAKNGHDEVAKILITAHAKVDQTDDRGNTPLMAAALNDHAAAVKLLLKAKADIELKNNNGDSALYSATVNARIDVVKLLIHRFIKLFEDDFYPLESCSRELNYIIQNGQTALLSAYLPHCKGCNPLPYFELWKAVSIAAKNGHTKVIQMLTNQFSDELPFPAPNWFSGPNLKASRHYLQLALTDAVCNGHNEIAGIMIKAGAQIYQVNEKNKNIIEIAIEKGQTKTVLFLLEQVKAESRKNSNETAPELLTALDCPESDGLIVDKLLDIQFKSSLKKGSFSLNQEFNTLSDKIHNAFMQYPSVKIDPRFESRMMKYLCCEFGFRHAVAKAVVAAVKDTLEVYYLISHGGTVPTAKQLKVAFAENLASSPALHDLVRNDSSTLETLYINHEQAPELARGLANAIVPQAELLLLTSEAASKKQQDLLVEFFSDLQADTTSEQMLKFLQEAGWHPMLEEILKESWTSLQQQKTKEKLFQAIQANINSIAFIQKLENLLTDSSRHLLNRQVNQLSEIMFQ